MKHFYFFVAALIAVIILMPSCKREDVNIDDTEIQTEQISQQSEGLIVLGEELEDPYAIANMKTAYSNLKSANSETPDVDISPTHTYRRFLPKNEDEWGILKSDTSIVLYDFPLNYEIVNGGTYYHDPSLPDSAITWQYCVIPIGNSIPNIQNELLYEVYIPAEDDSSNLKSSSALNEFLIELEYESVKLTGNLPKDEISVKSSNGLLPSKWRPKGTITVRDTILGRYIPLVQASVHARWLTHIETDLTDGNGYFETDKFRYQVNYGNYSPPNFLFEI